jgi:hypothetical protein
MIIRVDVVFHRLGSKIECAIYPTQSPDARGQGKIIQGFGGNCPKTVQLEVKARHQDLLVGGAKGYDRATSG